MSSLLLISVQAVWDRVWKFNSFNWEFLKYFRLSKFISDEWIKFIREEVMEAGSTADDDTSEKPLGECFTMDWQCLNVR